MKMKRLVSVLLAASVLMSIMVVGTPNALGADEAYLWLADFGELDIAYVNVGATDTELRINVASNIGWHAYKSGFGDTSWLRVTPATENGSGDGEVVVSLDPNTSTGTRSAEVIVRTALGSGDRLFTRRVSVTQGIGNGTLSVDIGRWTPSSASQSIKVQVTSDKAWSVSTENPQWLKAQVQRENNNIITISDQGHGNGDFDIYVERNSTSWSREGRIIVRTNCGTEVAITVAQQAPVSDTTTWHTRYYDSKEQSSGGLGAFLSSFTSATSNRDWLDVSVTFLYTMDGLNVHEIRTMVKENPDTTRRTGTVTIVTNEGRRILIPVEQSGRPYINLSPASLTIGPGENSLGWVGIQTNANSWQIANISHDWLEAEVTISGDYLMVSSKDPARETRHGSITVSGGGATATVNVTQEGTARIDFSIDSWDASPRGSSTPLTVFANVHWTAESDATWLRPSRLSGTNHALTLTADPNPHNYPREGTVKFIGYGIEKTFKVTQGINNVIDISDGETPQGTGWALLSNGVYNVTGDVTITGNNGTSGRRVVINSGAARVTLDNLTLNAGNGPPIELASGADTALTLNGENTIRADGVHAGIQTTGAALTIEAGIDAASLSVSGGRGAGIGGSGGSNGSNDGLAGGHGGRGGDGGTVTINGGNITAFSYRGAGIGGGGGGNGEHGRALVWAGGNGGDGGNGGNLIINGGCVTALSYSGAVIGGGRGGDPGHGAPPFGRDGSNGSFGNAGSIALPPTYNFRIDSGSIRTSPPDVFSLDSSYRDVVIYTPEYSPGFPDIILDTPVRVNITEVGQKKIYAFTPTMSDTYLFNTSNRLITAKWSFRFIFRPVEWIFKRVTEPSGELYDSSQNLIEYEPNSYRAGGIGTDFFQFYNLEAGVTYYFEAGCSTTANYKAGFYTLTVTQNNSPPPTSHITSSGAAVEISEPNQLMTFSFVPEESGMYTFKSSGYGSNHPLLSLFDSEEVLLNSSETSLKAILKAGQTYYIAGTLADDATGSFNLAVEAADIYEQWKAGVNYTIGQTITYGKDSSGAPIFYTVLQSHTSMQHWLPNSTVSLYKKIEYPVWVQPLGSTDAYAAGDTVLHNGMYWVSNIDVNVWAPGVFGWTRLDPA